MWKSCCPSCTIEVCVAEAAKASLEVDLTRRLAIPVGITATGQYYPDRIVTNDELSKTMDTNDEWIRTRTGISERRWVA